MGWVAQEIHDCVEQTLSCVPLKTLLEILDTWVEIEINVPIVFRGPNGVAAGVGAQHSQCFIAWYGAYPGLKVLGPYSFEDALGLLKATIRDPDPIVFLEMSCCEYGESFLFSAKVLDSNFCLPIGKAKVEREGKNVTITTFSKMVSYAIKSGISVDSWNNMNNQEMKDVDVDMVKEL
ncbi:pyruvate dehydrogenase E1 component subunit beta-1, mitochondrial-like [Camellia sinensis]|uniref:pyruvate dehydrogenase E1 component subunit beta-1, mitochondrial-like n=1 Tax=Camellia sinensis TaxID=4442 RepID=UPI001036EDB6|nr:pyruvate dehydrogenase E1 component subunit beta-1, mitochondrial-like [Camellia sinensis]